jgi:hypothetical protein
MTPLFILIILLAANPNPGEALSFNTTGFESCIFHVVDADGGSSLSTRDLIERIVTSSGGSQLWTMSTHNDSTKYGQMAFSFELEERCSVNIIVRRESVHFASIYKLFGFRVFNPKAFIIFVVSSHHREVAMRFGESADAFLITHLFLNILGPKVSSGIEESFVFCGRCTTDLFRVPPVHQIQLLHIWEVSNKVRQNFSHRTLLATVFPTHFKCSKWEPAVYHSYGGQRTDCDPAQVFIQYLTHQLNATHEYDIHLSSRGMYHEGQKAPIGVVSVDLLPWIPYPPFRLQHYLRDTTETRFVYCVRGVGRESFSFFFWAVPFDAWGWALLALSLLALTFISKAEWLDVFGALLVRQSYSTLKKNKTLILILFAAIVITCGYESIISSHIIVLPPIIVARRLKDLVDAGYGILGYDGHVDNRTIFLIMRRENISHSSLDEPPFIPNTAFISPENFGILMSNCNATIILEASIHIDIFQYILDGLYPGLGIRCHFVKETRQATEHLITYSGYFPTTFHTFLRSFQESGILEMLYDFSEYAEVLHTRFQIAKKNDAEAKREVPFEIRDPKILSIFIAWGGLLLGASLAFLSESLYSIRISLFFILSAIIAELFKAGVILVVRGSHAVLFTYDLLSC